MKRLIPLLIAGIIFVGALLMLQPEPTVPMLKAAQYLPQGHQIQESDLQVVQLPRSQAPEGAFSDPQAVIGQTLSLPRLQGDYLYPANLGGEKLVLAPDERAVAIGLNDSAGLAGMLQPGDRVGVTAVIFGAGVPGAGQGAFAKTISGGFRVLYISPDFRALDPLDADSGAMTSPGYTPPSAERQESGTVILAVPIEAEVIAYDFTSFGVESATRLLNVVDLLPALDHAQNVALSLFLEPDDPVSFVTSGVYLPDLVITPAPSPTPTETPTGYQPILTTPTPTP